MSAMGAESPYLNAKPIAPITASNIYIPSLPETFEIPAKPYNYVFPVASTALLMIDMQRDLLQTTCIGELQPASGEAARDFISRCKSLLEVFRLRGLPVFHTREGYSPDLSDCPSSKLDRPSAPSSKGRYKVAGDNGIKGRFLIRGEDGHSLVDGCAAMEWEVVIDKAGKGAFWNTTLHEQLLARGITHLVVGGVAIESSVAATIREANDRGFECCVIEQCTAGYSAASKAALFHAMCHWSQDLVCFVAPLDTFLKEIEQQISLTSVPNPLDWDGSLTLTSLRGSYTAGLSPEVVIRRVYEKIHIHLSTTPSTFLHLVPQPFAIRAAKALVAKHPDPKFLPPLFGVPFSLLDNIDVASVPTTVACLPLTYIPSRSSAIYETLISLGAIFIGKTNLDQLATGLTGCRSPYGTPTSVCNPLYISGGSSSGAAVSVGADLVSFAVAAGAAGSGLVPAGFNGVVGWKPTRGTVSLVGVANACKSLDCISFMATRAGGIADVRKVWTYVRGYDPEDPYSRPPRSLPLYHIHATVPATQFRFGVPSSYMIEDCSPVFQRLFSETVELLEEEGGEMMEVDDFFSDTSGLYDIGMLVNEKLATIPCNARDWFKREKKGLHEDIRKVFGDVLNKGTTAEGVFRNLNKSAVFTRKVNEELFNPLRAGSIDVLVVPTAPGHYTVNKARDNPISLNMHLNKFTHLGDMADLCAVAVPAGWYLLKGVRMPFSVTFFGRAGSDGKVLGVAGLFEKSVGIGAYNVHEEEEEEEEGET